MQCRYGRPRGTAIKNLLRLCCRASVTRSSFVLAAGLVLLAAAPTREMLALSEAPVLIIAGELDGVLRFSAFGVARFISVGPRRRFAVLRGASHHSFTDGDFSPSSLDLKAISQQPHLRRLRLAAARSIISPPVESRGVWRRRLSLLHPARTKAWRNS